MFIVTGISHVIILLLLCLWSCPTSSFVSRPSSPSPQSAEKQHKHAKLESSLSSRRNHLLLFAPSDDDGPVSAAAPLSHAGIEWRLRPPEGTSRMERFKVKLGASALRLEGKLRRRELPPVLCPKGGRALLEAYYKGENWLHIQTLFMLYIRTIILNAHATQCKPHTFCK